MQTHHVHTCILKDMREVLVGKRCQLETVSGSDERDEQRIKKQTVETSNGASLIKQKADASANAGHNQGVANDVFFVNGRGTPASAKAMIIKKPGATAKVYIYARCNFFFSTGAGELESNEREEYQQSKF